MYARHSLYNECEAQSRNGGLVHLTVASVYLELGGFRRCLEVKMVMMMIAFDAGCVPIDLLLENILTLSQSADRNQDEHFMVHWLTHPQKHIPSIHDRLIFNFIFIFSSSL
jgi:hypothetical protein